MVIASSRAYQHGIRRRKHTTPISTHSYPRGQQNNRMSISCGDPVHFFPTNIFRKRSSNGASPGRRSAEDTTGTVVWIWTLFADDALSVQIVGADGAASKVRELAGVKTSRRDYHQRGLVATVEVSKPNSTAWQRFLPTGPFALLPVRNGYFNIVWSVTEEVAKAVESANERAAVQAFNEVRSQILIWDHRSSRQALHGGHGREDVADASSDLDAFRNPPQITKIAGGMPKSFPLRRQLADKQ